MYLSTGDNMLSVAKNLEDKTFFRRLNAINCASDGVANDVLYHHLCWNSSKRKAEVNSNLENHVEKMEVISDIELLNYVRLNVRPNQKKLIDMNDVNSAYEHILLENGESAEIATGDRKKYLKSLIAENIDEIVFVKDKNPSKPEKLSTNLTVDDLPSNTYDDITTVKDMKSLLKIAKSIRHEVLEQNWKFTGDFNSYKPPTTLLVLLKWILFGPFVFKKH